MECDGLLAFLLFSLNLSRLRILAAAVSLLSGSSFDVRGLRP